MEEDKKTKKVKKGKTNPQNKKIYKIILFILFLIILATSVSSGVYFYLKNQNARDTVSQTTYLGILEDGTYYIPKARKDIRFQIDSLDTNSYNLTDKNNNKVETTIIEKNGKKLIQANQDYQEGEIYTLELTDTIFVEEGLKEAKKLKFRIEESEKAEYKIADNVDILENAQDIQVQENETEKTIKIPNKELKENEIILVKNQKKENQLEAAYKIEKVENGVATVTTPQIADIYEELDLYQEHQVNFDDLVVDEEFKNQIEVAVKKSALYQFLVNECYAENIETKPKLTLNGNKLKIEININIKANGEEFLGIKALKNHDVTLKFIIDLEAKTLENAEKNNIIGIDLALKQGFEFDIELKSNQTIEDCAKLSDEEYSQTIQDIIAKLDTATIDQSQGKVSLGGVPIPTSIPFVNVYFDIYFQTEMGLKVSLTYNQRVEMEQYIGFAITTDGFSSYANVSTPKASAEVTVLGKAEMRFGIGVDIGISFGSEDMAYVAISNEAGLYGEIFAAMNSSYNSTNQHVNEKFVGKIEAGVYLKTKFIAGINVFFIKGEFQKDLAEKQIPLLEIGTDEITTGIKSSSDTVIINNNNIPVPTITKVIRNLSDGTKREEPCEDIYILFEDMNGNTLSRVGNIISYGKNEDTTIKAVYQENNRIYKTEIKVKEQKAQTSGNQNNQTVEVSSNASQNKNIIEAYRTYVRNKKYTTYSNKWMSKAESYCVYDINQDGIEELLIMSGNDIGWRNTLICSYANGNVVEIKDIYSYGELRYSVENKEIVYPELKPYKDVGVYGFYQLRNNQFVLTKSTGWAEEGKYFLETEGSASKTVTAEESKSYFKNLAYFKFSDLSSF